MLSGRRSCLGARRGSGPVRLAVVAAAGFTIWASTIAAGGRPAAASPDCRVDLAAPEVVAAVEHLPPYPGTGWLWDSNPSTFEGNFNPCAPLSVVLATVERATGTSPVTALLFHDGTYIGTAASEAYPFTSLNAALTTDDTVVLDYKTPGTCSPCPGCACRPADITSVRYRWRDNHVVRLDPTPSSW